MVIRRSRSRRWSAVSCLLLLALIPQPAHAQFGSLKKKLLGKKDPPAQSQQQVGIQRVVITPAIVAAYLRALQGKEAEMRKMAQENSPTGHYYAALLKSREVTRRQNDFRAGVGPEAERYRKLVNQFRQANDTTYWNQAVRLEQEIEGAQASEPSLGDLDWQAQTQANDRIQEAMRKAAGDDISPGGWLFLVDRMPILVWAFADDPNPPRDKLGGDWTDDELAAVRAQRVALARADALPYRTDAEIEKKRQEEEHQKQVEAAADKQQSCMEGEISEAYQEKLKSELEAAQKAGDTQKMMALSQAYAAKAQAAMQKCQPH